MFPLKGPGIGLLLLRLALACVVILLMIVDHGNTATHPSDLTLVGLAAICLAQALGLLTPIVASIILMTGAIESVRLSGVGQGLGVVTVVLAISQCLLGPGAYSFDALIYGRRILDLPRHKRN